MLTYKVKRIYKVSRYEKVGEEKDSISGIILTRFKDKKTNQTFLTFKSYEDAEKYYEYWLGHDKQALKWYVDNAILTKDIENDDSGVEVCEFETENGLRYTRPIHFEWGKTSFQYGIHLPASPDIVDLPPGWFNINEIMKEDKKIIIGIGSTVNMGKSFTKEISIDDFMKLMRAKGKFYTPYVFENNKRNKENAYRPENTITMLCIDIDNEDQIIEFFSSVRETFFGKVTYYLKQTSKSGKGVHIFIPLKVKDKIELDRILNYMQIELKGLADISIYEPARLIFSSPYPIEEVSYVALASVLFTNETLTEREPVKELHDRLKEHQLTREGRKNYVKNSGFLYIRTYVSGEKLLKYFEEKHGKLTSKKLFSIQVKESEKIGDSEALKDESNTKPFEGRRKFNNGQICKSQSKSETALRENLRSLACATVKGKLNSFLKKEVKYYGEGIIGLIRELSDMVGFPFKEYKQYDKDGNVIGKYYQISLSPNEKTPMDIFLYDNNPEFFYFQSENALRHLPKEFRYIVSYTSDGRPCLHISWLIKILYFIIRNFKPDFDRTKIRELIKKYQIHNKYLYTHFEEVSNYTVMLIKALTKKKGKPVRVTKYIPKEIVSKSKVWKAIRMELERLGFVFKRKRGGLVVWYEGISEEELKETSFKGLPPNIRKALNTFFEEIKVTWYAEWVENELEHQWVKNMWYWVTKAVADVVDEWEKLFGKKLRSYDWLWWEDKGKLISAKSYVITKMVA